MRKCHACGKPWEGTPGSQPGRNETCAGCGADLHCCRNCRLYDPSVHNQCLSRTTEPVREKDKRNFCDEFEMGAKGGGAAGPPKEDMEKKWKDLFQ
ncbi:MAG TPA: hypothetical protein VHE12_04125 [bacterium]|nr:hypothetical protein [bacterium]